MSCDKENSDENIKVAEVQRLVLQKAREDESLFDASDIPKIVENEQYLKSYLERQKWNVENCVAMMENALKWRKDHNIPHLTDLSFSRDFYEIASLFIHGYDNEENVVLYIRSKYGTFTKESKESFQRTSAYFMFKAHETVMAENRKGWTLFMDMSEVKISQCDFVELFNVLKILVNYIPGRLNRIIMYRVPWFAKTFTKIAKQILPADWKRLIHFAEIDTVSQLVATEQLPKYMTTPDEPFVIDMPKGVKDFENCDDCDLNAIGIKIEDRDAFKQLIMKMKQY